MYVERQKKIAFLKKKKLFIVVDHLFFPASTFRMQFCIVRCILSHNVGMRRRIFFFSSSSFFFNLNDLLWVFQKKEARWIKVKDKREVGGDLCARCRCTRTGRLWGAVRAVEGRRQKINGWRILFVFFLASNSFHRRWWLAEATHKRFFESAHPNLFFSIVLANG